MTTTCKEEARRWVHLYAVGGAAFAALPVPISTTAALAALEAHMFNFIGSIYGEQVGPAATAAADVTFTVMGQGLRFLAHRAIGFIPVLGPLIKAGIAAATIESIGHGIVGHFERKNPGKLFTRV